LEVNFARDGDSLDPMKVAVGEKPPSDSLTQSDPPAST